MRTFLLSLLSLAATTFAAEPSLNIEDNIAPQAMGGSLDPEAIKREREQRRQQAAMDRIEARGFYAVAIKTVSDLSVADGSSEWELEVGEAFPFIGFDHATARVKLGRTFIEVPRDAIKLVPLHESPELLNTYRAIVRAHLHQVQLAIENAELQDAVARAAKQRAIEAGRQQLIEWDTDRRLNEQARAIDQIRRERELESLRARQR